MSGHERERMRGQRGQTNQKTGIPEDDILRRREWSNAPSIAARSSRMRTENSDRDGSINCHKIRKECVAGALGREEMESGRPECFTELAKGEKIENAVAGRNLG